MDQDDSPGFTYVAKQECVCGAPLRDSPTQVLRQFAWGEVRFVRCGSCGSYVQSPGITADSLARWYSSTDYFGSSSRAGALYDDYLADEKARQLEAKSRFVRDLQPFLARGDRLFEVGCATGSLLRSALDAGYEVDGIDLSETFVAMARDINRLPVRVGDFIHTDLPPDHFAMVVMLGTVSNLQDLPGSLRQARRILRPGGIVFANLPVADSLVARIYGSRYWMFSPSAANFMTMAGFGGVLRSSGFEVIRNTMDRQRPSLGKLLHHLKFTAASLLLKRRALSHLPLPFSIPLPGVRAVWARKARV